ncbi:hypothetical protein ACFVAQ_45855 [Streptomyces sp. NPDC057651]|uniref:hypothetical protein n=1 Tax=Streptomyces sp. NPDC057651 TaxID=3346194 RepID=UPI00368C3EDF
MSILAALAVVAVILASGIPLGRWACRRDPGPRARARAADRALLRLARTGCTNPAQCPTCTTLDDRTKERP